MIADFTFVNPVELEAELPMMFHRLGMEGHGGRNKLAATTVGQLLSHQGY